MKRASSNKFQKISHAIILFLFILIPLSYAGTPAASPTVLPVWIPTPQVIQSLNSGTGFALKAKTQQVRSNAAMSPMLSGPESSTITVDGLLNCPEQPDHAPEAAAAVKIQVTPGYSYLITLQDGCISYGNDDGGTLYGTRLRIRQATDASGTNLTSAYSTVGYGAYNYGPVFYSCDDAKAIGFSPPYNPVTITANDYYLYFTPDDVYGGWCGDNGGSETVQIYQIPTLQDVWNRYDQQQSQISDITFNVTNTFGTKISYAQYYFKQPNRYKYLDTSLSGLEAAYNGSVLTTRNKVSNTVQSMNMISPRIINKLNIMSNYRSLTTVAIDVSGTTINEKGQQSILLNVHFQVDSSAELMNGSTKSEQVVLFDYTEGVTRQIILNSDGTTVKTTNFYYTLNSGTLIPSSRYMIDSNGNTISSEIYNTTGLNQGLSDSVFLVVP